jgi:hypothetical protein
MGFGRDNHENLHYRQALLACWYRLQGMGREWNSKQKEKVSSSVMRTTHGTSFRGLNINISCVNSVHLHAAFNGVSRQVLMEKAQLWSQPHELSEMGRRSRVTNPRYFGNANVRQTNSFNMHLYINISSNVKYGWLYGIRPFFSQTLWPQETVLLRAKYSFHWFL